MMRWIVASSLKFRFIEHEGISRRHDVGGNVRGRDPVASTLLTLLIVPGLYLQFATSALPTTMET